MNVHQLITDLHEPNDSKIVLLVADGLGGLPIEPGGKTELETAKTPNLDRLVQEGTCGLSVPVLPGITPGSGPGHLGLFGYDPLEFRIGRGILEALGIAFDVGPRDVAARGNLCNVDEDGKIADRRAGRPPTERCVMMCDKLRKIRIRGVELFVEPVREHRFVLVIRGDDLGDRVNDTDPQRTGVQPLRAAGEDKASETTAAIVNNWVAEAGKALKDSAPTNMVTLRGFAKYPAIGSFEEIYRLRAAALAVYPMYRGLARLVGMNVLDCGKTIEEQMEKLAAVWNDYDFFFVHFKYTDSTGEDGDFDAKVEMTEKFDAAIPAVTALKPDVVVVTGDHSTPSKLRSHSWHPVPALLRADSCRYDNAEKFGETACRTGGLGQIPAMHLMTLAMAHAGRLGKFGA